MPPPTDPSRRERILSEARGLLEQAKGKTWQQLASEKEPDTIFAEPLPDEELFKSPMSYPFSLPRRSRSADFSCTSNSTSDTEENKRESYLSRWSRENTPSDNVGRYARNVRRSYTPVRDVADFKVVHEPRSASTGHYRNPIGVLSLPYRTSLNYARIAEVNEESTEKVLDKEETTGEEAKVEDMQEEEPIRKYDVFQVRSWSYPIYKYLNTRDTSYERPYSYTRTYGTTPAYTPPMMSLDSKTRVEGRRGYSGYSYVGMDSSYDITSRPRSLTQNNYWKSHYASSPWYSNYYGSTGLRHFNSYRPRAYNPTINTYWKPYY